MSERENVRVLIVDDQDSIRQLVRICLRGLGIYHTAEAPDGARALEMMAVHNYDVILLDGEMPRLSGLDTLRAIRADRRFADTPVIMVTSRADADFVRQAASLGVSGYVVKPVAAAPLGLRIDAALRARQLGQTGTAAPTAA